MYSIEGFLITIYISLRVKYGFKGYASSPRKTWDNITSVPALDGGTFKVSFYKRSNGDERAKYPPSCSLP
jgi:hypothetical protein